MSAATTNPSAGRHDAKGLASFARALLTKSGVRDDIAGDVTDVLVEGDLMGHTTHGLALLAGYLAQIEQGGHCDLIATGSTGIERLVVNFANPDPALGDKRSEPDQPHPILSDPKVRQALSLAIDRKSMAEQVWGIGGKVTCNIVTQPTDVNSPNTTCDQDVEKAKQLLGGSELSMTRIAAMVGFQEAAAFSKFFRAATGVSPRDFRARAGAALSTVGGPIGAAATSR